MKITFLGATGTVTGSKYLVENDKYKLLVDCGLFQGLKELRLKNWEPFFLDPKSIDAVLLTHAHIDHSGCLPLLVKQGFKGPIYTTLATYELCKILLPDSGYLHEEDAKRANQYHYSKHSPALPLYTREDAIQCLKYFKVIKFDIEVSLFPDILASWKYAGHILGAAYIELQVDAYNVTFSGDMGRLEDPVMNPPASPDNCRSLIIESTYGNRLHSVEDTLQIIASTINEAANHGGTILIPAFAVGRTQAVMYYLDKLMLDHKIPNIPIYLDSPMAISATQILIHHLSEHRLNENEIMRIYHRVTYINSPDESKAIDAIKTPKIIISASGMMSGGRILHHLKCFGQDSKNTILLTGFQATGTRGARLLNHETHLKIHGDMVPMNAKVVSLMGTSAHADYQEILTWIGLLKKRPQHIFITHGEPQAAFALQQRILERFHIQAVIPKYQESYQLS